MSSDVEDLDSRVELLEEVRSIVNRNVPPNTLAVQSFPIKHVKESK